MSCNLCTEPRFHNQNECSQPGSRWNETFKVPLLIDVVRKHGLTADGAAALAEEDKACDAVGSSNMQVVKLAAIKLSRRMVCWRELAEDLLAHMDDYERTSFFVKRGVPAPTPRVRAIDEET